MHPDSAEELPGLPVLWFGLCGATAGAAAGLLTNPLDLAKLRIQVQRGRTANVQAGGAVARGTGATPFLYRHMFDGLAQIVQKEGVAALWKGALARCAFQARLCRASCRDQNEGLQVETEGHT